MFNIDVAAFLTSLLEKGGKLNIFNIDVEAFLTSLPIMGKGMLGIFIVIGVIALIVAGLGKTFPDKKD